MSWFRFARASRKGTNGDGFLTRFFSRPRASSRKTGPSRRNAKRRNFDLRRGRALAIDPLESRCLLSVTPSNLSAIIVNQTFGSAQSTTTAHSVAMDNAGDFLVTWTRTDSYTNPAGTTFPVNNVYARYYTNAVQRITLPTSLLTTTGTTQPTFSLRYNDQTIQQISVTGASQSPSGNPNAPATTNISGTFTLFFNTTGSDTQGAMVPTVGGGTQSNLLVVDYNEVATFVDGVQVAGPAAAAAQIQTWLRSFAPVAANLASNFAGSDATHATVNAIDAHSFVLDYGQATAGLDQSSLLQYISTEATSATQAITFTSTAGSKTTVTNAVPTTTPNPVQGNFALQVGGVLTASIAFSSTNLNTTAGNIQTALRNAGFTGAIVTAPAGTTSPWTFNVTFTTPQAPVLYVIPLASALNPLPVSFSNAADANTLTGFLPSVSISTLDKPFTISNIPFSQINATLTAQAISGAFQAAVNSFSTGVAPINFITLAAQLPQNPPVTAESQNPYTTPIYNNVGAPSTANVPVTGWNPSITVQPVVTVNTSGTDVTSLTTFDLTFTSVTGTTVDKPVVVTDFTAANGGKVIGAPVSLPGGVVQVPGSVPGATVVFTKQSGNEFQVNPPQPFSIYTANQAPLNSTQPSVSMDGSGDFVITWAGEVSQQLAPKNFTDIYFRMYTPVGVTPAGTTVLGAMNSDLYQQQELIFNFATTIPGGNTSTFKLRIGGFLSDAITFNTDPSITAANIQNALANQFPGVSVSANSTGNPYNFLVVFNGGGAAMPAVQYVSGDVNPLPADMSFSAVPEQSFTGVRLVTNPTQKLQFQFTTLPAAGDVGAFKLQIGSFTTAAITFNTNPTVTALNIQNALTAAGFPGTSVSAQSTITTVPGYYTFSVNFTGYNTPPVQYIPIAPASGGLPASVIFLNSNGDPYTVTVNANYTNPQFQPDVAMDPYGNFVIVWANQGPDESYFNDISMQCFDNAGNPLGNNLVVNQDPTNPAQNFNTDTNFNPKVAIGFNSVNPNNPITDNIVVTYTTAIELPSQVLTNPNGTVYVRGYSYNPQQKQGPAPLSWNQLALANNGGNSSVSLDGQNNFIVAWQQNTDSDSNGGTSEGVYATEYQLLNTTTGAPLNNPANLRPNFRVSSSSTNTASQTIWPFNQEASQVQMTISGDIVTSYQGYAPAVSDNISIPSNFFTSIFAFEKQNLTFAFPGGVPVFNATNNTFALQVGTAITGPITFSASATTTANNIRTALNTALTSLGFTTPATVTGTLSGNTYTFKVTLGAGPSVPAITYVGALPGSVTFSNSVAVPATAQKLTFAAATVPVNGLYQLKVGAVTTATLVFDSTNPTKMATSIQTALINAGFAGTTVTLDVLSTPTSFIFDVLFTASQAAIAFNAAPVLPGTLVFGSSITAAANNADLLAYFNPLLSAAAPAIGSQSPSSTSLLYLSQVGSTLGAPSSDDNYTVINAIDKVLFQAEYAPPPNVPAATQTQLARLNTILESVAGLLRGDANGVMTSQWDADNVDSKNSTYSDNIVSTQRDGENQKFYLVVPYDVQQGQLILQLSLGPVVESPNDVVPPASSTVITPVINMPSTQGAAPGGPIDIQTTAQNISAAIDIALGFQYGEGSVNVRQVSLPELNARTGTKYQVPTSVYNAAAPTSSAVSPTQFITRLNAAGQQTVFPASPYNINNAVVYELQFEGQAHDIPISVTVAAAADAQWVGTKVITAGPPQTSTTTFALGGASPPVVIAGDYSGVQGTPQYNPSLGLTSAGNMVVSYTNQILQTDQSTPATDAAGNLQSNVYYNSLAEATDIAGPHIVNWTDGNGVNLLNAPKNTATGVNAQYMVLTFDEPMLADNPATDLNSVYNPNNYQIYDSNGNLLSGVVSHVDYGLSMVSQVASLYGFNNNNSTSSIPDNKWEVVLTINDPSTGGALADGTYTLKVLAAQHQLAGGQTGLCNIYGTPLNLTGFNQATPTNFQSTITINKSTNPGGAPTQPGLQQTDPPINIAPFQGGQQIDPAVSSTNDSNNTALNGNYVVVWTSKINGQTNIVGQMYKASGVQIGGQFQVNTTASTSWGSPDVAMDAAGNFVIVWCGAGPNATANNTSDIYARAFTANGQALTSQFLVDQFVLGMQQPGVQNQPRVAMSPDGTFVITWTSTPIYLNLSNLNAVNSAIFARAYNNGDVPIGNEFQVTPSSSLAKTLSDVALDANDNFVVTWEGDFQNSSSWGVYGNYYTAQNKTPTTLPTVWSSTGVKLLNQMPNVRGSFTNTSNLDLHDSGPRVAMIPTGTTAPAGFAVTWADYVSGNYSIFAQQFGAGGTSNSTGAFNTASTIQVNQPQSVTGAGWQLMSDIGIDPQGDIGIAWTSFGQDNASNGAPGIRDYGIYSNIYYSSTSVKGLAGTNSGAFRVNATTLGNQLAPAISFNNFEHDAIIAWVGPDTTSKTANATAIFDRVIDPPDTPPSILVPVTPTARVSDTTLSAGTTGGVATFTVTLSSPATKNVSLNYSTGNGTGLAGTNYTATSGTLTFAPGQTSKTVSVNVAGMSTGTTSKTFSLGLSSPTNATIARTAATATITNNTPSVTTSPANQTFVLGQTVTFTAAATGSTTPTVQWQISTNGSTWTNIAGATKSSYTFTPTADMSGDLFRAVFTNSGGSTNTSAATLSMASAPIITTNPASTTVNAGTSVTLTAAATGVPTPTVQWQLSVSGGAWTNISGATSTSYSFTSTAAMAGNQYRAVFTNTLGTATTLVAALTINVPPVVTTNPVSQTVTAGTQVTFTAAATDAATPAVQWQVSTNGSTWTNLAGATSTSYSVTTTAAMQGYQYRAVFSDSYGLTATTTAATVSIISAPAVTTNPTAQTGVVGATVSFTAVASGYPVPTVQWQLSTDNGATFSNISGATATTYSVAVTTAANGNQYRAVFTNSQGTATTSAALLTVTTVPVVTTNPLSKAVTAGTQVTFTSAASGATNTQWQSSTNGGSTWINIIGATASSYTVTAAATMTGYQYRAYYTNAAGAAASTVATLTVGTPITITSNPQSASAAAGASVTLTTSALGSPTPTVQWQVSSDNAVTYTNLVGATATTYTFTAAAGTSGYKYRAVFTSPFGVAATSPATLTITTSTSSQPVITANPVSQSVAVGATASFTAAATGATSTQWQSSTNGGSTWTNITGATSGTYSVVVAASMTGNQYRAQFTNASGTVTTSAATLTVGSLTITSNPQSTSVAANTSVTFTTSAVGSPTPTVQWQVSTDNAVTYSNIAGATTTSLTLTATTAMNGYKYRAVFTNSLGVAATSPATLTVSAVTGPAITANPTSQAVATGAMASFTASATGATSTQWQLSTNSGSTWTNIAGATAGTYTVTAAATMTGYQYRALFTNASGSATTSAATLTVGTPVAITANPVSKSATANAFVTFTAAATGSPAPTVQWQVSSNNALTWTNIAGATATSYTVTATTAISGTQYRAVFTNAFGTAATSPAVLSIAAGPAITVNPVSQSAIVGQTISFTAAATGSPAPTIQWQASSTGTTWINIPGANSTTFTLTAASTQNGYQFRAVFTNSGGTSITSPAKLTIGVSSAKSSLNAAAVDAVMAGVG
jgi:hypothetical protein